MKEAENPTVFNGGFTDFSEDFPDSSSSAVFGLTAYSVDNDSVEDISAEVRSVVVHLNARNQLSVFECRKNGAFDRAVNRGIEFPYERSCRDLLKIGSLFGLDISDFHFGRHDYAPLIISFNNRVECTHDG